MGFTYSFFDNQSIGASDLNKLTKRFVKEGIEDSFTNGTPYNLSVLNSIVFANTSEGIVPETDSSLKVSVSGNNVIISSGSAFFADGSVIDVDLEGITIPYTKGSINYVYLISDTATNTCKAQCSLTTLTGNVLLLAIVNKDGSVTDKRKYAKGKIPSAYSSGTGLVTYSSLIWTGDEIKNLTTKEIAVDTTKINGIISYYMYGKECQTFGMALFDNNGETKTYLSSLTYLYGDHRNANYLFSDSSLILENNKSTDNVLVATVKCEENKIIITPTVGNSYQGKSATIYFYVF